MTITAVYGVGLYCYFFLFFIFKSLWYGYGSCLTDAIEPSIWQWRTAPVVFRRCGFTILGARGMIGTS